MLLDVNMEYELSNVKTALPGRAGAVHVPRTVDTCDWILEGGRMTSSIGELAALSLHTNRTSSPMSLSADLTAHSKSIPGPTSI